MHGVPSNSATTDVSFRTVNSVKPSLAPPSPHPPSATTRGLYCLACIISGIIGSAIGIFFWKYAKFFVCGVGGFALGWYVIALQTGGVVSGNIIARWGIIGGKGRFDGWFGSKCSRLALERVRL
jgi:hypothetical protein